MDTKNWYLSRTIRAGLIGAVASLAAFFNIITIDEEIKWQIIDIIMVGVTFVTGIVAIYGRLKAKKEIV